MRGYIAHTADTPLMDINSSLGPHLRNRNKERAMAPGAAGKKLTPWVISLELTRINNS
jgi:hypothetical protein